MPYEFKMTRRIEFAETDLAGIVHFSNFFRMMEAAEHAFFRSLGHSIHSAGERGAIGWPRVSASCDYTRPLRFEDEVEIHLLVMEVRQRSIRYQFTFRKLPDGPEVARGAISAVCAKVERTTGNLLPVQIPDGIREKISAAPSHLLGIKPSASCSSPELGRTIGES
jgi:YbgC/YbaW family acyl-CoA thioester hydrolase